MLAFPFATQFLLHTISSEMAFFLALGPSLLFGPNSQSPLQSLSRYVSSKFVSDTKTSRPQLASKQFDSSETKWLLLIYFLRLLVFPSDCYFPSPLAALLRCCSGEVLETPSSGKCHFLTEVCAVPTESKCGHCIFP